MATKECLHCKQPFELTRSDKRFCNSTCRSNYFNGKKKQETQTVQQLKGIVTSKNNIENIRKDPNEEEIEKLKRKKTSYEFTLNLIQEKKKQKELERDRLSNDPELLKIQGGVCVGGAVGALIFNDGIGTLAGSIIGGIISSNNVQPDKQQIIYARLQKLNDEIQRLTNEINSYRTKIKSINFRLSSRIMYPPKRTNKMVDNSENGESKISTINHREQAAKQIKNSDSNIQKSKNVVSSSDLVKMDYKQFDFQGRWLDFIGNPAINFFAAIHGKAGEGKSTFAIQFANYLATNFGKVIYISGEEGFSKTFKDKFERQGATSPDLYVGDIRSFEDIVTELKKYDYHFVFIDSLDTLKIGPDEMKQLRQTFTEKAFITISQSTKDGKMRGSYEIIHDSDVVIQVADGVATTTKNRFLERERVFEVF